MLGLQSQSLSNVPYFTCQSLSFRFPVSFQSTPSELAVGRVPPWTSLLHVLQEISIFVVSVPIYVVLSFFGSFRLPKAVRSYFSDIRDLGNQKVPESWDGARRRRLILGPGQPQSRRIPSAAAPAPPHHHGPVGLPISVSGHVSSCFLAPCQHPLQTAPMDYTCLLGSLSLYVFGLLHIPFM